MCPLWWPRVKKLIKYKIHLTGKQDIVTGCNFSPPAPPGGQKMATSSTSTVETGFLLIFDILFATTMKLPLLSPCLCFQLHCSSSPHAGILCFLSGTTVSTSKTRSDNRYLSFIACCPCRHNALRLYKVVQKMVPSLVLQLSTLPMLHAQKSKRN